MAEYFGYKQFFSRNVRYQSKADASEHIIFHGARDLNEITRARPEIDFGIGLRSGKGSISDFGNRRQLHLRFTGDRRQ